MQGPQVPKELRYTRIKPKGFSCQYKQWAIDPMSSNAYWNPTQIVRFLLNLSQGVMDPYRSSILIDVAPNPNMTVGLLQVDSSAQSFINQMVISSNGVEVERIVEYDTLAAYLTDIGFSQLICSGRDLQGLGLGKPLNTQTNRFARSSSVTVAPVWDSANSTWMTYYEQVNQNVSPTRTTLTSGIFQAQDTASTSYPNTMAFNSFNNTGCNTSISNSYMTKPVSLGVPTAQFNGYYNLRAQYAMVMSDTRYPDSTTSTLKGGMFLQNGASGSTPNSTPYQINQVATAVMNCPGILGGTYNVPNQAPYLGFQVAYSPMTCTGCFQPVISNTVASCAMQNGNITQQRAIPLAKRFMFPLLSTVCGALIPPDSYQLIPLESLKNLLIELTLNPFAMFSSGYPDRNQWDVQGMVNPLQRNFRIVRMQYVLNIYYFVQQSIRQYISNSLLRGVTINNEYWQLSAQYQLPNGSYARAAWPVNSTAQSLSQIVVLFLTNDHQLYPFCRKQFRLSNNINSMQIKYNADWFPPQPITGNAGNPQILDTSMDNSQYYLLLLKSQNYLFSVNSNMSRINRINFAINNRIYDPTNQATMLPQALSTTPGCSLGWGTSQTINVDTAMGMPFFHQNRYRGTAAFVYSFEPFAHSKQYMNGIDTRSARPLEVVFGTNPVGYFPRDQTMYIFIRCNTLTVYTKNGVQMIGK